MTSFQLHARRLGDRLDAHVIAESEAFEIVVDGLAEMRAHVERRAGRQHDPHDSMAHLARERNEAACARVERRKCFAVRDVRELAAEIVRPRVVTAREGFGVSARRVDEARAAMPAHVDERAHAVIAARDEHGNAGHFARDEAPAFGDFGCVRDRDGHAAKHRALAARALFGRVRARFYRRVARRCVHRGRLSDARAKSIDERTLRLGVHAIVLPKMDVSRSPATFVQKKNQRHAGGRRNSSSFFMAGRVQPRRNIADGRLALRRPRDVSTITRASVRGRMILIVAAAQRRYAV